MVSTGTPWVMPEDKPALIAEGTNEFAINRPGSLACHCVQRSPPLEPHGWSPRLEPHSPPLGPQPTAGAEAHMRSAKIPLFFLPQDLKHFSKIHGFTYAIVWQPIYGGGTDRDGCFIMKKGKPLPEKLKVDMLKSFGGFASASRTHHFLEGQTIPGLAFDRRDWAYVADMQARALRVRCVRVLARVRACGSLVQRLCSPLPCLPGSRALPTTSSGSRWPRSTT